MGYESSAERWSPVQSVEKILLSVVSMLAGECRGRTPGRSVSACNCILSDGLFQNWSSGGR